MPEADATRDALVAERAALQDRIQALRTRVQEIDRTLADGDAKRGLARRLANLTPAERKLLEDMAEQKKLEQLGLRNPDGTVRPRPR